MGIERLSDKEISRRVDMLNSGQYADWQIINNKLYREYIFKSFSAAMDFIRRAAERVDKMNHHPEWCNVYNRVSVSLTTHDVGGLTQLDFNLAAILDECASSD